MKEKKCYNIDENLSDYHEMYDGEYAEEFTDNLLDIESDYEKDLLGSKDDMSEIDIETEGCYDIEKILEEKDLGIELDELEADEEELENEDDATETAERNRKETKNKHNKEKKEHIDHTGTAVRERFYRIMEDYHSGDKEKRESALERAMKELEGFVHLIIKRSYSTYTKKYFYDLIQEGNLGIMVGMEKYDPSKSMPTTFFFPYIKHEMQGFITKNVDKTTSHYSTNIKKINKVIEKFEEKGIQYSNVDIAIQTGMTIETVDQSMSIRNYRDEVHIDACPPNVIDDKTEHAKRVTPEEEVIEKETINTIYRTINTLLTKDEIVVLQQHFGLNDTKTCSEGEIAKNLEMPKDKVKRLLNRAIRKLRNSELVNLFGDNTRKEQALLQDVNVAMISRDATKSDIDFLSQLDDLDD